jgi:AbrB family looped-hinge helix DNA binding protein
MTYAATVSSRGQVVIPAFIRKKMQLKPKQKLSFYFSPKTQELSIKKEEDILDLAGTFKTNNPVNVVETRDFYENQYA